MSALAPTWHEVNQSLLMAALSEVRAALERLSGSAGAPEGPAGDAHQASTAPPSSAGSWQPPPALETLCAEFGLSPFERKIVLMCAGVELDSRFAALYAAHHGDPRRPHPTFSLALAAFGEAHWSALSPSRPLRHWHLVELLHGEALTVSPLRIDERVLHYLTGVPTIDERLRALVKPLAAPGELAPSQRAVAEEAAEAWSRSQGRSLLPILQLCGDETGAQRAVAAAIAASLGLGLHRLAARDLPHGVTEIDTFVRLWEREAILSTSALLIECDDPDGTEAPPEVAVASLLDSIRSPLLVSTRCSRQCAHRSVLLFDVAKPTAAEQIEIWHGALAAASPGLNGDVAELASQFSLSSNTIRSAADQALRAPRPGQQAAGQGLEDGAGLIGRVWDACRLHARPRLERLAQRIEPAAAWDDLVLPERQQQVLQQIAIHVRRRATVYRTWGFAAQGRGAWGSAPSSPVPAAPARRWRARSSPESCTLTCIASI